MSDNKTYTEKIINMMTNGKSNENSNKKEENKGFAYIFLDIDGVLNNMTYWEECYARHKVKGIMSMNCFPFDPKCLNNLMCLNQYIKASGYEPIIVLSSTWRLSEIDTAIVNSRLAEYGMRIFDSTPSLYERGEEIKYWLKRNTVTDKNIVLILDDNTWDIRPYFDEINIIETDQNYGFNEERLKEAKEKFYKQI